MRNFDLDLSRVTYEHFITGKAAINFPRPHATSGGWHYLAYWNSKVGEAKVSLAGIHYPDTRFCFGDTGILNATDELELRGWKIDRQIYMADHFRATGDMVLKWVFSSQQAGKRSRSSSQSMAWFAAPVRWVGALSIYLGTNCLPLHSSPH